MPTRTVAPDGDWVFVLGADPELSPRALRVGDFVELKQEADFDATTVLIINVRILTPEDFDDVTLSWKLSLLIDSVEYTSRKLGARENKTIQLQANVAPLGAGDHEVTVRLELDNA